MTVMEKMNLFSYEKITENVYIVTENYSADKRFTIGVISGTEGTLVMDTGFGMAGDLRSYIETLVGTGKPMCCVCTHGHSDVLGAVAQFDEVYLKHEDVGTFEESTNPAMRLEQLAMFTKQNPQMIAYGKSVMLDNSKVEFKDVSDGQEFHLGGIRAQVIAVPGHTPGSIALRITGEHISPFTFAGDIISSGMNHMLRMSSDELAAYAGRLEDFMDMLGEEEPIYCSHAQVPMQKKAGLAIAEACREVAAGHTNGDAPFSFGSPREGEKQPNFKIHYASNYYIVYNADLV